MKLIIGVPILFPYVHWKFWKSFMAMKKPNDTELLVTVGTTISVARNRLVAGALKADYLLFLDSDMELPVDLIDRLFAHKKDVVSALAFSRGYPHDPMTYREWKVGAYYRSRLTGGLIDVDATGCACLLIKTDVFNKIEKPWFDFSVYKGTECKGEDIVFCEKLKAAGYEIFVDTGLECGHISDRVIGSNDWRKPTVLTFEEFDKMRDKNKIEHFTKKIKGGLGIPKSILNAGEKVNRTPFKGHD